MSTVLQLRTSGQVCPGGGIDVYAYVLCLATRVVQVYPAVNAVHVSGAINTVSGEGELKSGAPNRNRSLPSPGCEPNVRLCV